MPNDQQPMTKSEELFHQIATEIPDVKEGKMFGALCYKTPNGKSAGMLWKEMMVFKLTGDAEKEAMKLKGVHVFEPMKGRKMTGWYCIPVEHSKHWKKFALESVKIVKKIKK
jgi:hypothetical protein